MKTHYRPRIVLAEDDPTIARLIEIALHRTGIPHDLQVVHDGDAAIAALDQTDLLLLDLHLHGKNGFEVLEHVKQDPSLRRIPVLMFSSSTAPADVNRAYDLHANAYLVKRTDLLELGRTLDATLHFWLRTATPAS
jgi:chemotaxis family two-component system response regulator Rcp1